MTVGTHPGHLPTTTYHVVATSFVDNHRHFGLSPRNSTLSFSPLTRHPSQPRPISGERGAHYNHPQPARVAVGLVGQTFYNECSAPTTTTFYNRLYKSPAARLCQPHWVHYNTSRPTLAKQANFLLSI